MWQYRREHRYKNCLLGICGISCPNLTSSTGIYNVQSSINTVNNNNIYNKIKIHNYRLGFDSVANRPSGVLILQYNPMRFLNW